MNRTDGSSGSGSNSNQDVDTSKWKVTEAEYLKGRDKIAPLTEELRRNLHNLLIAVNLIRDLYGKPLIVSSGYRPAAINQKAGGATRSAHLTCEAVDFLDPKGELAKWCVGNLDILEQAGLYLESPAHTQGPNGSWVHLQSRAPRSGKRIFLP